MEINHDASPAEKPETEGVPCGHPGCHQLAVPSKLHKSGYWHPESDWPDHMAYPEGVDLFDLL